MEIRTLVGQSVRTYREALSLSQEQLAFKADLHQTYVSGVERGIRNPTIEIVARLAAALGIKPSQLLEG
ncbi:MAG: helix-turn-helix transcriptional regulator [Pseudomonadota bacterium]